MLYCQHHLERGRPGRLLAALVDPRVGLTSGFGISEDTALVVDLAAGEAQVIGARDVLHLRAQGARRGENGAIRGVRAAYLTPGDRVRLESGGVLPAPDKQPLAATGPARLPDLRDAWARGALRGLFQALAQAAPGARVVARDPGFDVVFSAGPPPPPGLLPARWPGKSRCRAGRSRI